jgi:hypothetical protein
MPVIDYTEPLYSIAAISLFLLCTYLSYDSRRHLISFIVLSTFLVILVGHAIELIYVPEMNVEILAKNLIFDYLIVLISLITFLIVDHIEAQDLKRQKKSLKFIIDDDEDILWKKV